MVELVDKCKCSGCAVCAQACPRAAIEMRADSEGFLYPVVDDALCVGCGVCRKACPVLNRGESREPQAVYAAMAHDNALRAESSSGGIFSLLARQIFAKGGIVFGAAMSEDGLSVLHQAAEDEAELARLRGSKYVQSAVGEVYRRAQTELARGRQVLFSGTPCQIAGLRRVLRRDYDNLLCVDVICHGTPSPLAWREYLAARTAASAQGRDSARADSPKIERIAFRRKNCGWKRFSLSLRFAKDREYRGVLGQDPFLRGFLGELYNRPSCHQCSQRDLRSGSDLTIGDYWGVAQKFPEMDDDKGTSLVLVNTLKGEAAFGEIRSACTVARSDFADACRTNPSLRRSPVANERRSEFFKLIDNGLVFDDVVTKCLRPTLYRWCRAFAGRVLRKLGVKK